MKQVHLFFSMEKNSAGHRGALFNTITYLTSNDLLATKQYELYQMMVIFVGVMFKHKNTNTRTMCWCDYTQNVTDGKVLANSASIHKSPVMLL